MLRNYCALLLAVVMIISMFTACGDTADDEPTGTLTEADVFVDSENTDGAHADGAQAAEPTENDDTDDTETEAAEPEVGNISFSFSDGTLTIFGTGRMEDNDDAWLLQYEMITTVVIEPGVTSIRPYAFYCCINLTDITIPDSVTGIGDHAFQSCNSLTEVTIPDSVTSIGEYSFSLCENLSAVTIPSSVISIGENAFRSESLTDVYYKGTEEQWLSLTDGVDTGISALTCNIHYEAEN